MSPPSEGMSCRDACRVGAVGARSSEEFSWGGGSSGVVAVGVGQSGGGHR